MKRFSKDGITQQFEAEKGSTTHKLKKEVVHPSTITLSRPKAPLFGVTVGKGPPAWAPKTLQEETPIHVHIAIPRIIQTWRATPGLSQPGLLGHNSHLTWGGQGCSKSSAQHPQPCPRATLAGSAAPLSARDLLSGWFLLTPHFLWGNGKVWKLHFFRAAPELLPGALLFAAPGVANGFIWHRVLTLQINTAPSTKV